MSQARPVARRTVAPRTAGAGAASPRLGLALLVIATAQLMVLLDGTVRVNLRTSATVSSV